MPPEQDAEPHAAAHRRAGELFAKAASIMARLRAPGGCPWDRQQTFATIRKYTLEETYEVLDAIEREHWADLADELGDLLLQVLFYAEMAEEAGHFSIRDVIAGLNRKLVRRHPHVFGEAAAAEAGNRAEGLETTGIGAGGVLRNWEEIKRLEKEAETQNKGRLDSVSRAMPALMEAGKISSKAAKAGFDWPEVGGVVEKLREETEELDSEIRMGETGKAAEELGDLLFTTANLARHLKVDAELTLRDANEKFRRRFAAMEAASDRPLEELAAEELEALWSQAKSPEMKRRTGREAAQ
jgi:nucleoside triphosphate diphosphatase